MAVEKHEPSTFGLACICLYGYYYSIYKKSNPFFFWNCKRGGTRILQYACLSSSGLALVPDSPFSLWVYFWAVPLLLGEGKKASEADRGGFYPKKIRESLAYPAPIDSRLFLLPYLPKNSEVLRMLQAGVSSQNLLCSIPC